MPELVYNQNGDVKSVPVDDLDRAFDEFKQSLSSSRLEYRKKRKDTSSSFTWATLYDCLHEWSGKLDEIPKWGSLAYDEYLDKIWKQEPILAGTIYGMVSKAQSKPWRLEGGRNNTARVSQVLANAGYSFYKHGWSGLAGLSALDFYTTRIGFVWGVGRRGTTGPITSLEHVDALSCQLTAAYNKPVRYRSRETGQTFLYKAHEVIQENSMMLSREEQLGYGMCAVERAIYAIQLLLGLHQYDIEKLSNLPPEGIATITGMTKEEFFDAMQTYNDARKQNNSLTFPQVLWLLNINSPSEGIDVNLTPFSTLPEQFNRQVVVEQYVNILANAFGVSASDIWFMGGGPFGTGKEVELQHSFAKGKGEGEWFSRTQQVLNYELPPDVKFTYDTSDIEEDLNAAQTAKAWVEALLPLVERSQEMGVSPEKWMRLFQEKGVIPPWFLEQDEPEVRHIVESGSAHRMKSQEANDLIAFVWELGRTHEVPVITTYREKRPEMPPIRGMPIPDKEVERGARVTRKAIDAEQAIWRDIPELQVALEAEDNE